MASKPTTRRARQRGHRRHDPARLAAAERQRQALHLRAAGFSYRQIGKQLGFSGQAAWLAVNSALARTAPTASDTDRTLELQRLDAMFAAIYADATSGNLDAIGTVLGIMVRRARLLGIDAPGRIEHVAPIIHRMAPTVASAPA